MKDCSKLKMGKERKKERELGVMDKAKCRKKSSVEGIAFQRLKETLHLPYRIYVRIRMRLIYVLCSLQFYF